MMKIKLNLLLLAAAVAALFMSSCKKDNLTRVVQLSSTAVKADSRVSWYTPVTVSDVGPLPVTRGLHVGTNWYFGLDSNVYQNVDITSVALYCFWSYLEPSKDQYDWLRLDSELTHYTNNGKNISIVVAGGCRSPQWIYNNGVRHFTITEHHNNGSGSVFTKEQPVVFDSAYVALFTDFVQDLAAHMQTMPYWDKLTHVNINGVCRTTEELRLPNETGQNGSTNSVALWKSVGYTSGKVIRAFKDITTVVASSFPNRLLEISYIQDQANAFHSSKTTNISLTCFNWMKQQYGDRVIGRYTAVKNTWTPHELTLDLLNIPVPIAGEISEGTYSTTTNKTSLTGAIQKAIDNNMTHLQVYPDNVTRFPDVMITYSPQVFKL